jgi:BirA family biotin operon repressor/biotin-[acetyl-CoA-carboxylase] ligase
MNSFQPKILRHQSVSSTNSEIAQLASRGAEEGTAVVADEQTAGRGRLQRKWASPKGAGLYFSILLRPKIALDRWPLVTFIAALAVSDALGEACRLQTDIKWPNDLLAGERKICGILAESIDTEFGKAMILGIGINLTRNAYPAELTGQAISVEEATGYPPNREEVLAALLRALTHWYRALQEPDGMNRVIVEWMNRSSYGAGRLVKVTNGEDTITGVTRGLEPDGGLRLETEAGAIRVVRAGDVMSVRAALNQ